ncbi:uncharacterized protein [Dermacentor albipictus]|uniref:uncharacterized protein isoform X3 n=1 Tax=Dermacentor albipictus TaxID=60249 RepID=UPI0038FD1E73
MCGVATWGGTQGPNICVSQRTREREDYGVILFTSLFVKHPEYHLLFKKFRANNLSALKKDPKFRSSNRKDSKGHVVHEQPVSTSPGSS